MTDAFVDFTDNAQIWIHGFANSLTDADRQFIEEKLNTFLPSWNSHGTPVRASFQIIENRFLVTVAECPGGISGCSVDSFFRVLKEIAGSSELNPLETDLVYFRYKDGKIQAQRHLDFFNTVESGAVTPDTHVFDTLLTNLSDFRQGRFERCFSESWHARSYPLPQSPATSY